MSFLSFRKKTSQKCTINANFYKLGFVILIQLSRRIGLYLIRTMTIFPCFEWNYRAIRHAIRVYDAFDLGAYMIQFKMGGLEHQIIKDNAIMVFEIYEKQRNLLHIDLLKNYIKYDLYHFLSNLICDCKMSYCNSWCDIHCILIFNHGESNQVMSIIFSIFFIPKMQYVFKIDVCAGFMKKPLRVRDI